jgi:hypothetical protein
VGGRFCVGAFERNLASVAMKMFFAFSALTNKFGTDRATDIW